jgi:hypothetical protein
MSSGLSRHDVAVAAGLAVAAVALNALHASFNRAAVGTLAVNQVLRLALKAAGVAEYRVLRALAWAAACGYFVGETYLFDNASKSDTKVVQGLTVDGKPVTEEEAWDAGVAALRTLPALGAASTGTLLILLLDL